MRKFFSIIICSIFIITLSCEESTNEKSGGISIQADKKEPEYIIGQCVFQKSNQKKNETFPFNVCDKIELVTYDSTNKRDGLLSQRIGYTTILKDSLGLFGFSERIRIDATQADSLFGILFNYKSIDDEHMVATCYNPGHAILFYKEETLVEYFEICFSCSGYEYLRKQSSFRPFCNEQWSYLHTFFKTAGIKKRL